MATTAPISRRSALQLFGATPFLAIPVETRPAGFADALRQYKRLKAVEVATTRTENIIRSEIWTDAAFDATRDAFDRLMAAPAPDIASLAEKMVAAMHEYQDPSGRGYLEPDEAAAILGDAQRLGAVA